MWHSDLPFVVDSPELISGYTLAAYRSKLVVVGGLHEGLTTNKVWSLDSMRHRWESLPPMPTCRSSVIAVGHGDNLVVAGGRTCTFDPLTVAKVLRSESKQLKLMWELQTVIEVFSGESKQWIKVKPLPKAFSRRLTSVLHTDKKWYVMEENTDRKARFRATYSVPIVDLISDSPDCQWKLHSAESCPPPGKLPPASFSGQLIAVGNNDDYTKAKARLYFHSRLTDSWISIENIPYVSMNYKVVGIVSLSSRMELMLMYCGSTPSEQHTVKKATLRGIHEQVVE